MLPDRVDAVIVGGGASGLALAGHLATTSWRDRRVLVVDDGSLPLDARSWAYWSDAPSPLDWVDRAAGRAFDRFWIKSGSGERLVRLDRYRYRVVRGPDLERAVDAVLCAAPGFDRIAGHVSAVRDGQEQAAVVVDGDTVHADWVFDSVGVTQDLAFAPAVAPVADPGSSTTLELAFTGRQVETDTDAFDPEAPTLMDFRTGQGRAVAFVYVLPTSARSGLVEHTRFARCPGPQPRPTGRAGLDPDPDADAALDAYLRDVLGVDRLRLLSVERGVIPLRPRRLLRTGRRVVPIGTPAGMVKPSTGYAYARIQRQAEALAWSLATANHPFDVQGPAPRFALLDRILLDVISHEPQCVVRAFEQLFRHNPGDRVLAFLDERTNRAEELALIRCLPKAPFLRAARRVRARSRP